MRQLLLILAAILLVSCFLIACNATPQATKPTETTIPVTSGVATHAAIDTRVARYREERMTVVALTPARPIPLMITPLPTPTWGYGLYHCSGGSKLEPELVDCWRGIVNGEVISIASGNESPFTDPFRSQGVIVISHGPYIDPSSPATEIYSTPLRLGTMRIAIVSGTLFSLAPIDIRTPRASLTPWATQTPGVLLVFDLSTRQWVSPPPLPTSSQPVLALRKTPPRMHVLLRKGA